jgi:hypothetical protein
VVLFRLVPTAPFKVVTPEGSWLGLIVEVLSSANLRRLCMLETDSGWKVFRGSLPTGRLLFQEPAAADLMASLAPWLAKQQVDSKKLIALNAADDWARINAHLLTHGALDG